MRPHFSIVASTSRMRSSLDWFEPVTPMPPSSAASASPLPEDDRMATLNPSAARRLAALGTHAAAARRNNSHFFY